MKRLYYLVKLGGKSMKFNWGVWGKSRCIPSNPKSEVSADTAGLDTDSAVVNKVNCY